MLPPRKIGRYLGKPTRVTHCQTELSGKSQTVDMTSCDACSKMVEQLKSESFKKSGFPIMYKWILQQHPLCFSYLHNHFSWRRAEPARRISPICFKLQCHWRWWHQHTSMQLGSLMGWEGLWFSMKPLGLHMVMHLSCSPGRKI